MKMVKKFTLYMAASNIIFNQDYAYLIFTECN